MLIELLVEELPPKSLKQLGQSFGTLLFQGLQKLHNLGDGSQLTTFASPRRLAAHITHVLDIALQPPQRVKLMPVSVGVGADGEYTPAFHKKLRQNCGYRDDVHHSVLEERISRELEGKTEFLFHTDVAVGVPVAVNVQQVLSTLITKTSDRQTDDLSIGRWLDDDKFCASRTWSGRTAWRSRPYRSACWA